MSDITRTNVPADIFICRYPLDIRISKAVEDASVYIEDIMGIIALDVYNRFYETTYDWSCEDPLEENTQLHDILKSFMLHYRERLRKCLLYAFMFFNSGSAIYEGGTYHDDELEISLLLSMLMFNTLKNKDSTSDTIGENVIKDMYKEIETRRNDRICYSVERLNVEKAKRYLNGFFRQVLCHADILSLFTRAFEKTADLCSKITDGLTEQRNAYKKYILLKEICEGENMRCGDIATIVGPKLIQLLSGAGKRFNQLFIFNTRTWFFEQGYDFDDNEDVIWND